MSTGIRNQDRLPTEIDVSYRTWRKNLHSLKEIKLQRFVLSEKQQEPFELHVSFDASEKAYAACVYVDSTNNRGERSSNLLVEKCKVSPLKTQSIPRLELCAVLLGSLLVPLVIQALERISVNIRGTTGWSDSTIVLCWLSQEPSNWTTFVAIELPKYSAMTVFIGNTYPQRTIQLMQRLVVLSQVHSRAWKFGGRDQLGYVVECYRHHRN